MSRCLLRIRDNSGNEATATRTVFVTDSDSPSIMITGPAAITITLGTPYNDQGAVCGDNADPEPNPVSYTHPEPTRPY